MNCVGDDPLRFKASTLEAEIRRLEDLLLKRNAEIARGFCDKQEALTAEDQGVVRAARLLDE